MAYYVNVDEGPQNTDLSDFTPSFGESLATTAESAWEGNATPLGLDYLRLQNANSGSKLARQDAEQAIKDAGVKLDIPDGGYTRDALDMLIKRKQDEAERQNVMSRTPWSLFGSPVRGAVSLAAGMLDPLNVAASFVPVVGEERVAAMLARAGTSALSRAGARAAVGAVEGAAGAGILEPFVYGFHNQMQDDYSLANSLQNLAFGGLLGGGLHVLSGAAGDLIHGIPDLKAPAAEAAVEAPKMDMGVEEAAARMPNVETKLSAPFTRVEDLTPEQMRATVLRNSADDFRAELLAEAGGRAEPGAVAGIQSEIDTLRQQMDSADVKVLAKQLQQTDKLKFKDAMAAAEKQVADQRAQGQQRIDALQGQLETNRTAARAEQDLALLNRGEVPERFAERVDTAVNQMRTRADIAHAYRTPEQSAARYIAAQVAPETRNLALRSAVAQAMDGRMPEVEPIIHSDPASGQPAPDISQMRAAAEHQAAPGSRMTSSPDASIAGEQRLRMAPKDAGVATAEHELQKVMDDFTRVRQNLEESGLSAKALREVDAQLKGFDDLLQQSDDLGNAARAAALCGVRS